LSSISTAYWATLSQEASRGYMNAFMIVSLNRLFVQTLNASSEQALARYGLFVEDPMIVLDIYKEKAKHLDAIQAMILGMESSVGNPKLVLVPSIYFILCTYILDF
jgi:hypothetical protein